jgi:hypothetical protein
MEKLIILLCMLSFAQIECQSRGLGWLPPMKKSLRDKWAQPHYDHIVKKHAEMTAYNTAHFEISQMVSSSIIEKTDRLYANATLEQMVLPIFYYLREDAKKYFYSKYPIDVSSLYDKSLFRNAKIQTRFHKKLEDEKINIANYLGTVKADAPNELYLSEGDRILLTLTALQNIIKFTLEHEEY